MLLGKLILVQIYLIEAAILEIELKVEERLSLTSSHSGLC